MLVKTNKIRCSDVADFVFFLSRIDLLKRSWERRHPDNTVDHQSGFEAGKWVLTLNFKTKCKQTIV